MGVIRKSFLLLGLSLASIASAQFAQHGVWVPGLNEPMPKYFTGTLNLARCSATSEGGWIEEARIYLKKQGAQYGDPLYEWIDDPDPGGPMSKSLDLVFDSTHFDDGDVVFVKYEVVDMVYGFLATTKSAFGTAIVHNNSFVYEHHDSLPDAPLSLGAEDAHATFDLMNYDSSSRISNGWTKNTVEADSYDAALLYFNTHGVKLSIDDHIKLNSSEVETWRQAINGTGNPPNNSTGKPFTQYVHFDTCTTAYSNKYSKWFWPYLRDDFTGNPPWAVVNQALFGYADETYWIDRKKMSSLYWGPYASGQTVVQMRDALVDYCSTRWDVWGEVYIMYGPSQAAITTAAQCPVWGDWYTRLSGVYTGNNVKAVNGWYR